MKRLKLRIVAVALLAALTVHLESCDGRGDGLHEQEFLCDEASARLTQCCGQEVGLYCTRAYGCQSKSPDLSADVAFCIREKSCADIVAAGLCEVTDWRPSHDASTPVSVGLRALSCH